MRSVTSCTNGEVWGSGMNKIEILTLSAPVTGAREHWTLVLEQRYIFLVSLYSGKIIYIRGENVKFYRPARFYATYYLIIVHH